MNTENNTQTESTDSTIATAPVAAAPVAAPAAPAAPKVKKDPKPMFSTPCTQDDKNFIAQEALRLGGGKADTALTYKAALSTIIAHYKATVDLTITITPPAPAVAAPVAAPAAEAVVAA